MSSPNGASSSVQDPDCDESDITLSTEHISEKGAGAHETDDLVMDVSDGETNEPTSIVSTAPTSDNVSEIMKQGVYCWICCLCIHLYLCCNPIYS